MWPLFDLQMSPKFIGIEVNGEDTWDFLYVFPINIGFNMIGLWNTPHWNLKDFNLTFQCNPRSTVIR